MTRIHIGTIADGNAFRPSEICGEFFPQDVPDAQRRQFLTEAIDACRVSIARCLPAGTRHEIREHRSVQFPNARGCYWIYSPSFNGMKKWRPFTRWDADGTGNAPLDPVSGSYILERAVA